MARLYPTKIKRVQNRLLGWYKKNGREFLWRKTSDPYTILISEVMLQQTQSRRVEEKLPAFLKRFPNFVSLANASKAEVIRAWQGMGYNNRAVRLLELAKQVVNEHNGKLPRDIDNLRQLPGIGRYTSHAIACFAFRKRNAVVDVNVRRVLSRLLWKMKTPADTKNEKEIWKIAEKILSTSRVVNPRDTYSWNQTLMELGSTICLARKPSCSICPVQDVCSSKHLMNFRAKRLNPQSSNPEPLYKGIPRRIWRGKIVETLRHLNGKGSMKLIQLVQKVKDNAVTRKDYMYFEDIIQRLERDGIVQHNKEKKIISLAH